ncbi:SsgA family sporulation/cell division regulator [Streptomyces ardesiacus]|uniref:SsgA family sporulation/cell division regulator n=1 Tax=Streptomyces ardesiacus TaxID=285564 RepID=UPI00365C10F0
MAGDGISHLEVVSFWGFNPEDPWVICLSFEDQSAVWIIGLELVTAALTDPYQGLHGYADVQAEVSGENLLLHLDSHEGYCQLKFPSAQVEEFLNEIDTSNAQMVIGQKLDEFLETL